MKTQFVIVVICVLLGWIYGCLPSGPGFDLGLVYGLVIGVLLAILYETLGRNK